MRYKLQIQYFAVDSVARALAISALNGGGSEGGGSDDYTKLKNKPSINSIVINGDKTPEDLGLQRKLTAQHGVELSWNTIKANTDDSTIVINSEGKMTAVIESISTSDIEDMWNSL